MRVYGMKNLSHQAQIVAWSEAYSSQVTQENLVSTITPRTNSPTRNPVSGTSASYITGLYSCY